MRAFIPIDITDDMLISSTIVEPDAAEPAWNSAITYAADAVVSVVSANKHEIYVSAAAGNFNNPPATSPTKWVLKSYTNRFRMFEWNQGDPSVATSPLTVVLRPGSRIDALMLEGVKASVVDVTVRNGIGGPVVFTIDGYLLSRNVASFFDFLFAPFIYDKVVATFGIPPIPDPVVYLTLSDPSGTVELGRFAVGLSTYLGPIQWSPISDSDNYSEVTRDKFGRAKLTPIPSMPTNDIKLEPNANMTNLIRQFKVKSDAKAVVWSALDDMHSPYRESLVVIGVHSNFRIDISNNEFTVIDLAIKGI